MDDIVYKEVAKKLQKVSVFTRESLNSVTHVEEGGEVKYLGVVKDFRSIDVLDKFIPQNARLAISWVRLAKDEQLNVHTHPIDSLYIVCEGEGILLGGEKERNLKKGDIITIPTGCDHGFIGAGDDGYWGLSIQFAERGIYENPEQPLVAFKDNYELFNELKIHNNAYAERFKENKIFKTLLATPLNPKTKSIFLDYLQILSEQFQKMVLLRSGLSEHDIFTREFWSHLKEEFGHNELLINSRTDFILREDAIFEALCLWFNHKMLTLDNIEKLVLVHMVIETSADIFYSNIKKEATLESTHIDTHSEHDHNHQDVNKELFKNLTKEQFLRLKDILRQGWNIVERQYERFAEIVLQAEASLGAKD